jgi:hypothetical protein
MCSLPSPSRILNDQRSPDPSGGVWLRHLTSPYAARYSTPMDAGMRSTVGAFDLVRRLQQRRRRTERSRKRVCLVLIWRCSDLPSRPLPAVRRYFTMTAPTGPGACSRHHLTSSATGNGHSVGSNGSARRPPTRMLSADERCQNRKLLMD